MREKPQLIEVEWDNDDLFFTYSYEDETSMFDKKGRWNYGSECYEREYKVRIPKAFENCEELIHQFIELMIDNYNDCNGFWVN